MLCLENYFYFVDTRNLIINMSINKKQKCHFDVVIYVVDMK